MRVDLAYVTKELAKQVATPTFASRKAMRRVLRYVRGTMYSVLKVAQEKMVPGAEVTAYADAGYAASADRRSTSGRVMFYRGVLLSSLARTQSTVALSTAEAEYIALSQALRAAIPVQNLMKEFNCVFPLYTPKTNFCITVHEDNQSTIAMAKTLKFTPRTKHIAIKYHHFRSKVETTYNPEGDIRIKYIPTEKQLADIMTKPVEERIFFELRRLLCGW